MNKCKCELNKCALCPQVALSNNLCIKCNDNYYQKENVPTDLGEYINCYKEPEGYYLENNLYKKCYYTCKLCDKGGNDFIHHCIECGENFLLGIKMIILIAIKIVATTIILITIIIFFVLKIYRAHMNIPK